MTNEELKKKIVEIFEKAIGDWYEKDDGLFAEGYTPEEGDNRLKAFMADALIAAGLTFEPIIIHTIELPDECEKKIHDILKEEEAIIEEVSHRAARAEKALMTVCTNVVKDEEDDVAIEPRARVLYKAYLKQAEKELAEERKDD